MAFACVDIKRGLIASCLGEDLREYSGSSELAQNFGYQVDSKSVLQTFALVSLHEFFDKDKRACSIDSSKNLYSLV